MKKSFNLICYALLALKPFAQRSIPYTSGEGHPNSSFEYSWEQLLLERIPVIEKAVGIPFEKGWFPVVTFYTISYLQYDAMYDHTLHSFFITPQHMSDLLRGDTLLQKGAMLLMDHELGHALADQFSHRLLGKVWPDTTNEPDKRKYYTRVILSEGVAEYIMQKTDNFSKASKLALPKNKAACTIYYPNLWQYPAGYWTVQPILDQFGSNGLLYIMNHPQFPGHGYNMRRAAQRYQKRALRTLTKQKGHMAFFF